MNYSKAFKSNKGYVSDKWGVYLEAYDDLLNFNRNIKSVLEIGVQNGGSLVIWSKVLPRRKVVVGVDSNEKVRDLNFKGKTVKVIGDVCQKSTIEQVQKYAPYDLIVDDGSHNSSDIVKSFVLLWPLLAESGRYVVEDLHCSYWPKFQEDETSQKSAIEFLKLLLDVQNIEALNNLRLDSLSKKLIDFGVVNLKEILNVRKIEFRPSICLITKGSMSIGQRLISGRVAKVESIVKQLHQTPFEIPSEH